MTNRDELKRFIEACETIEKGYQRLVDDATRLGVYVRMLRMRAQSLMADMTPVRAPSASALEATRSDSRTGKTSAGGFKVGPYKPT